MLSRTLLALTLVVSVNRSAAAQASSDGTGSPSTVGVTLVLKERLNQPDLTAIIQRTKRTKGTNVIAFRRDALTPELIAATLRSLIRSTERDGETLQSRRDVYFRQSLKLPPVRTEDAGQMEHIRSQLLSAELQVVTGVGRVHATTLNIAISP